MILNLLFLLLILVFLIRTVRVVLYHLFWWERKEYRFDRMFVHLRETTQGRYWLINPLSFFKWLVLLLYFLPKSVLLFNFEVYILILVYFFEGFKSLLDLRSGWKKPTLRVRPIGLFILTFSSLFFLAFHLIPFFLFLTFFALDKVTGPIIALFVFLSNRFFDIVKQRKIKLATEKIKKAPNLKVIGITGSYGKTTTKEFTAQLISSKYRVLKTPASQNTDIGIAELILKSNLQGYDYFICEMSAYCRGEIAAICRMFKNKIIGGVITGINEQHQSLFGSLETTKKAKFELIEAINPHGFAFFNGESEYCHELFSWAKKRKFNTSLISPDFLNKFSLRVNLPGEFFKENLALSIALAENCGLNKKELEKAFAKINMPDNAMNVSKIGKSIIIDNTFNANPDGVYQALKYLGSFKEKKILVIQPLIELGKYAKEVHQKIGKEAASICDAIVLANQNFSKYIKRGAHEIKSGERKVMTSMPFGISEKAVYLFIGKESKRFLEEMKKEGN